MAFTWEELSEKAKLTAIPLATHADCEALDLPWQNPGNGTDKERKEYLARIVDACAPLGLALWMLWLDEDHPVLCLSKGDRIFSSTIWMRTLNELQNIIVLLTFFGQNITQVFPATPDQPAQLVFDWPDAAHPAPSSPTSTLGTAFRAPRPNSTRITEEMRLDYIERLLGIQPEPNDAPEPLTDGSLSDRENHNALLRHIEQMGGKLTGLHRAKYGETLHELLAPVDVTYIPSSYLDARTALHFNLPNDIEALKWIIVKHREIFRRKMDTLAPADGFTPILAMFRHQNRFRELEHLAWQAGGELTREDPNENGVFVITYHRYARLRLNTMTPFCQSLPNYPTNHLSAYRKGALLYFPMPIHYDHLYKMLLHDANLYQNLPASDQHPMSWYKKHHIPD